MRPDRISMAIDLTLLFMRTGNPISVDTSAIVRSRGTLEGSDESGELYPSAGKRHRHFADATVGHVSRLLVPMGDVVPQSVRSP